ncbi:Putative peptidoglycan binding domain-containing protein [Nocardioides sp. YR527]|uniref:peptidoglycan-binding domain-containing protein n=1 Tax=Nocardioides sp. YR527 TaxID=1881028 RepID=UPI000887D138|nr:peptidoglycan-binding protein [Nocardioides sp. YR527]SDK33092.1 Putative peptidoglycan binding domain-containing protein [Nocardioides sp. YR527]
MNIIRRLAVITAAAAVAASSVVGVSIATAPEAQAASCSTKTVKLGSKGTCVKELQRRLGGLSVDGNFGKGTRNRVRAFQTDTGLAADGIAGKKTWAKLNRYGTAVGWVAGGTLYACRKDSSRLMYSLWNNTGKTAAWEYKFAGGTYYTLNGTVKNTVKRFTFASTRASFDSRKLGIWVGTVNQDSYKSTTKVRDYKRSSLRTCA